MTTNNTFQFKGDTYEITGRKDQEWIMGINFDLNQIVVGIRQEDGSLNYEVIS